MLENSDEELLDGQTWQWHGTDIGTHLDFTNFGHSLYKWMCANISASNTVWYVKVKVLTILCTSLYTGADAGAMQGMNPTPTRTKEVLTWHLTSLKIIAKIFLYCTLLATDAKI